MLSNGNGERMLLVAAHPDDEVLGCGGTISRLAKSGVDVHIVILGEGITSRYRQRADADADCITMLHSRSRQVAEMLGARGVYFYNLPDNRFDTVPLLDIVKIIEHLIEKFRPEIICTHHSGDLNIDHAMTHRAVITAARPTADQPVRDIYAFEVPSSTEWAFQRFEPSFRPNVFMDISDTLAVKMQALATYESELREFPHPRSAKALEVIALRWGSVVGYAAAEAFELIRATR